MYDIPGRVEETHIISDHISLRLRVEGRHSRSQDGQSRSSSKKAVEHHD